MSTESFTRTIIIDDPIAVEKILNQDRKDIKLSYIDFNMVQDAISNPPKPNKVLRELMKKY